MARIILIAAILVGCATGPVSKAHPVRCKQSIYADEYKKTPENFIFFGIQCINL